MSFSIKKALSILFYRKKGHFARVFGKFLGIDVQIGVAVSLKSETDEFFGTFGEVFHLMGGGNINHILNAASKTPFQVNSRFDSHNKPRLADIGAGGRKTGGFMDFQSNTVAQAMAETSLISR